LNVDPSAIYDPGDSFFVVQARYTLQIEHALESASEGESEEASASASASEHEPLARVEFVYAALFELELRVGDEDPSEEELAAYASTTGHFALYPYVREYVQDVTGRLAFPPLTLRVLRINLPKPVAAD
jgi:preprotein translocase subunit SecB